MQTSQQWPESVKLKYVLRGALDVLNCFFEKVQYKRTHFVEVLFLNRDLPQTFSILKILEAL